MKITFLFRKVINYLNLEPQIDDFELIHQTIVKDTIFKGTNLWILIFAIVVASVGLNMNSTAVIIGAMLISPLMGPINGMGYSIATYDFHLLRMSLKNFSFAVITSLLASTVYFYFSPISTAHSELLARTSPTIYDVLIALFGGMAGIVAISSKQKGNVIPGVAIATALMPPLCTAGYGLATMQSNFFFGAIYLFTINTVFIALSSVLISQILNFPIRNIVEPNKIKRVHRWIFIISLLIFLPSIYLGYNLVQKEKFSENGKKFINRISIFEGNYLLKSNINTNKMQISLVFGGAKLNSIQQSRIKRIANDYQLDSGKIVFQQGLDLESFDRSKSELEGLKAELNKMTILLSDKEKYIDSLNSSVNIGKQILKEIQSLYPQIENCSYGNTTFFTDSSKSNKQTPVIIFETDRNLEQSEISKISNWLKNRLQTESINLFFKFKNSK